MRTRKLSIGGLLLAVPEGWDDITSSLESRNSPLTIADPDSGVGALQFSPAIYKAGALPDVTSQDLSELLREFAANRGLESPFDRTAYSGDTFVVGESFHSGTDLIRVWYCSDGKNVVLVTYVCDWSQKDAEAEVTEMTVRSIRFNSSP
jgi:hypothetical protein